MEASRTHMDARDPENQTGHIHSHPLPEADTPPLPVEPDEPIASSLDEGQSVFDQPPHASNALPLDSIPLGSPQAQEPTIPDFDAPHQHNQTDPSMDPLPLIASGMPLPAQPAAVEPAIVQPVAAESVVVEPAAVESAVVEPAIVQPQAIEPAPIELAAVEPVPVQPAAVEPAPIQPVIEQPFFPTIAPESVAHTAPKLTLAEKLALLKASLPAYPSPIHPPAPAPAARPASPAPQSDPAPSAQTLDQPLAQGFALPDTYQDIPFSPAAVQAIQTSEISEIPQNPAPIELGIQTDPDDAIELSPESLNEDSGIYSTAHIQAQNQLESCPKSPVLALTRDVEDMPLEDTGHARLPDASNLKFTGTSDAPSLPFDDSAQPSAPIPLTVSAVAAAGGTAVALGMQSPQDGFQNDKIKTPQSRKLADAKKASKKWWFIPATHTTPQNRQASRIDRFAGICAVGVLGLMAVLAARVVQLQLKPEPKIAALVDSQNSKSTLHYRRGVIEDRNGRPLSLTRATKSVFMDPGIINSANADSFTKEVGTALNLDPAALKAKLDSAGDARYVKLVRRANEEQNDALPDLLKNKELKPLGTETILVRDYPYKNLAAHLLGFVNIDGKGIEGVERLFDKDLTGKNGAYTYDRDSRHRSLWINEGQYQLPQDGNPVRLSIDITIQRIAEKELSASCKQYEAKSGAVIVMDPHTGEILALAVYPEIDANAYGKTPPEMRKNRAITDTYEPGSTFKPFVWAVATEQGYARPMEMLDCGPGVWRSSTGRTLHDSHPVGRATWEEVLVKSSNIGMAIVGERMGAQSLYNAVTAFGFGKPTGSGLPGEIGGILHSLKKWTSYSVTSIPMGQEISVTPMQMARAYCALANGGTLVTPTIQYVDPDSPEGQAPRGPRVLKPETAVHTRNVMRRVVLEGTGKQANSKLYSIFGKTGTAQMANPKGGGYEPDAYTGSFACGAPVDDARVVVVTILQRPKRSLGYYGGTIAAPAGMRIVEQTLAYLGVTPDVEPEESTKPKNNSSSSRILQVNNRAPGR